MENKENEVPSVKALSALPKTITYEEAIEYTTVGKFHYILLFFCCMGLLAAVAELIGISVIIYAAQCDLKFSMQEKSLLAMSAALGTIFSLHITGFICDTWGRIKTLKVTLILNICSSLLSAFSINTWMLIGLRFLAGIFSTGCQCCVFSFLGEFLPDVSRRRHMTILATMVPVSILFINLMAFLILPLKLTDYIASFSPWRALLLVNNIPSIIALVGFLFLPESPKFLLAQGLYVEALDILRSIFTKNTGKPKDSYPNGLIMLHEKATGLNNTKGFGEAVKLMGKQTLQLFHKKRILQTMNMSIIDLIVCIIGAGFTMWLPTVLSSFNDPSSEFLTVCDSIGLSKNHSSDICSNPNGLETSHFKTLVFIAMILIFCFLISSVAVGFMGRKIILGKIFLKYRYLLMIHCFQCFGSQRELFQP
ncbi:hypothetical protein ACFFRR_000206 [Megaselia abdita]